MGCAGETSASREAASSCTMRLPSRGIPHHDRKRLVRATLAYAKALYGLVVARGDGELVAAEALHGDDAAVCEPSRGRPEGCVPGGDTLAFLDEDHPWPARRAGVGLGVEPAVCRIVVLGATRVAHRERVHRRAAAVVGDAANDREPRSAIDAVDERIAPATVLGVEELAQACAARGGVGWNDRACTPA